LAEREDDWFRKNERDMIEAAREAREKRAKERLAAEKSAEAQRLKELHYMKCPKCGHDMAEKDMDGVAVDVCSVCEGVFFDAGELGKVFLKRDEDRKGFLRRVLKI
jgi:acetyl-CoA carboxylase beta subunit